MTRILPIANTAHWLDKNSHMTPSLSYNNIFKFICENTMLGPLCYKLITIVNCYLEAGLTCFVYCPKALYLIIFIVWHPF